VPGLTSSFGNARPAKKPISCSLRHSSILGLQGRIAQSKLQFTGNAAPASESPLLLKAATSARSSTTTTTGERGWRPHKTSCVNLGSMR